MDEENKGTGESASRAGDSTFRTTETGCDATREVLSRTMDGAVVESMETAEAHLSTCKPCRDWQAQTQEIIEVGRLLPKFDVAERLTQNILQSVAEEEKSKQKQLSWVVYSVGVVLFLWLLVVADAYESVWGIGSWLVGLMTMIALKYLVCEGTKKERPVS